LPFGLQGCQKPNREWQPARPALNTDQAFEAVFHLFLSLRTALEDLARADAIGEPSVGEEIVLCN
jgi:hypothetical protein